ncbi:MAG TPA: hypothetical protein VMB78_06850 [Dissulfurispiraceae bacterium]|nr:hypothetical protein [Dissulfurispiraceae bacterium]
MIDSLYLKSLVATLAIYSAIVAGLSSFVYLTGVAGGFMIFAAVVFLLCYFYGCFRRNDAGEKGLGS